ncbi:mucin-13-like [Gigantopelta aegis]|uniref:mucin-13-like n=1 Tax=Gigantopelta aegis TaxID=1735272 RepID=UPI001B8891A3|nr:mucin-13-like [Gigantopelta aegis]
MTRMDFVSLEPQLGDTLFEIFENLYQAGTMEQGFSPGLPPLYEQSESSGDSSPAGSPTSAEGAATSSRTGSASEETTSDSRPPSSTSSPGHTTSTTTSTSSQLKPH